MIKASRWVLIMVAPLGPMLAPGSVPAIEMVYEELVQRGLEQRIAGDWDGALATAQEWMRSAEADPSVPDYERASARAIVDVARRAVGQSEDARAELSRAEAMIALADAHWAAGEFEELAATSREQTAIRTRWLGEDVYVVAQGLTNEASARVNLGEYEAAEDLYRRALLAWEESLGADHPEYATCLSSQAGLRLHQGDLAGAKVLLSLALRIREDAFGPDSPELAGSLNNVAALWYRTGDYDRAVTLFRRVLVLEEARGDPSLGLARALENLGTAIAKQGDLYAADELLSQAHEMRAAIVEGAHPLNAIARNNRATLLLALGDLEGAEAMARESLELFEQLDQGDHIRTAPTRLNLAKVLIDLGRYEEARVALDEALEIMSAPGGTKSPYYAPLIHARGRVHENLGELDEARASYERTLEIYRAIFSRHPDLVESYRSLARVAYREGRFDLAREHALAATDAFEVARLRSGDALSRSTFQSSPYLLLAAIEIRRNDARAAWTAFDRAMGRTLEDLLAEHRAAFTTDEARRERELKKALLASESRLLSQEQAEPTEAESNEEERADLRLEVVRLESEWSDLRRSVLDRLDAVKGPTPVPSLADVQRQLGGQEALVGWLEIREPEPRVWAYVLRDEGDPNWVEMNTGPIENVLAEYRDAVDSPVSRGRVDDLSREVYDTCVAPLMTHLEGVRSLVVIPSGPMSGTPVEALLDEERVPLGIRWAVTRSPSAAMHFWLAGAMGSRESPRHALLVGDPPLRDRTDGDSTPATMGFGTRGADDRVEDLPPLPEARKEVEALAGLIAEAELLAGADATEQTLAARSAAGELSQFDLIHFATHAIVDPRKPSRSRLVLSQRDLPDPYRDTLEGRRLFDGFLTVSEILGEWDLDADLVTLSACESGLGRRVEGEGYYGFAHAFFAVGCRSLLVSQWPVHDESTRLLMERFYRNWSGRGDEGEPAAAPMSRREALREARQWLRTYEDESGRRYDNPYHWASFVLVGNGY